MTRHVDNLVIGAGPAGLTAAYALAKAGRQGLIAEADAVVGGLARTVVREGYRYDIGPHRFFSKVGQIESLWDEMLGERLLEIPRLTRIFYDGRFYKYPLEPMDALRNMGPMTAAACMLSYAKARLTTPRRAVTYEDWVVNQFGRRLFNMFFKSYTEKVWGMRCDEISADWAAQRIKSLSLGEAIRNAFRGQRKDHAVTTLINAFRYPRLGSGQMWEAAAKRVQERNWSLELRTKAVAIHRTSDAVTGVTLQNQLGETYAVGCDHLHSSMPLRHLLECMDPAPPAEVLAAASSLSYRDFIIVVLVLDVPHVVPDNWIYIHSPTVKVARIQEYKNWSAAMVPDAATTSLGLEYFVNEGDAVWNLADEQLVSLAYGELGRIGLAKGELVKGFVTRVRKAYPVYDLTHRDKMEVIRGWLAGVRNLACIGRNGQHRYNNQDHSMATGLIAAGNVVSHEGRDPFAVNEDAEYHEIASTERATPARA